MSTLPTSAETSWLFSSPGSVLAMPICRKSRGHQLDDAELGDVAGKFVEALRRPWRDQAVQPAPRNAVLVLQEVAHAVGMEKAERRFKNRTDLVADLQRVDRTLFHQLLQPFGEGGFAAADRAEQVEDLLAFLEPLRGIAEIAGDPLDRVFHAVEIGEGGIDLDRPVRENAAEPLVLAGVDQVRLADRLDHPFGRRGIHRLVLAAGEEILLEAHLLLRRVRVNLRKQIEDVGVIFPHDILTSAGLAAFRLCKHSTVGNPLWLPLHQVVRLGPNVRGLDGRLVGLCDKQGALDVLFSVAANQ